MFSIRARLFHLGTENQIYPKMAKFVTFVWKVLETWFWCLSPGFGTWEIHWDHCQTPQIDLSCQNRHLWSFWLIKIRYRGLKMAKFVTFVWKVLETWFWCLSPGFGTWEIHWDHCQTPQIDLSGQSRHLWSFWLRGDRELDRFIFSDHLPLRVQPPHPLSLTNTNIIN